MRPNVLFTHGGVVAKILHLGVNSQIRDVISSVVIEMGHEIVFFSDPDLALSNSSDIDLFIVSEGTIDGDHFNGYLFALERIAEGKMAIILADRHKFAKVPYLNRNESQNPDMMRSTFAGLLEQKTTSGGSHGG